MASSVPRYRSGLSEALAAPSETIPSDSSGPAYSSPVSRHVRPENLLPSGTKKGLLNPSAKRRIIKSLNKLSPAALEASGVITPALLAKHHLPDILFCHGPLSVRQIMAYLTTNVPGFSGVAPPKQRKLVICALERTHNGVSFSAGLEGNVIFEKVGVGKWLARHRGTGETTLSPVRIPKSGASPRRLNLRSQDNLGAVASSGQHNHITPWKRESGVFLQDEEEDEDEDEDEDRKGGVGNGHNDRGDNGEKVVLDDEDVEMATLEIASSSDCISQETLTDPSWRDDDSTDEEDWASIGAEGVRNPASIPFGGPKCAYLTRRPGLLLNNAGLARSLPGEARLDLASHRQHPADAKTSSGATRPREEQEAVEALVKLGSF